MTGTQLAKRGWTKTIVTQCVADGKLQAVEHTAAGCTWFEFRPEAGETWQTAREHAMTLLQRDT